MITKKYVLNAATDLPKYIPDDLVLEAQILHEHAGNVLDDLGDNIADQDRLHIEVRLSLLQEVISDISEQLQGIAQRLRLRKKSRKKKLSVAKAKAA